MVILEERDAEPATDEQGRKINDDGKQLYESELGRREMRGVDRNKNERRQGARDLANAIDPRVPDDGLSFAGVGSQSPEYRVRGGSNRQRGAQPRHPWLEFNRP